MPLGLETPIVQAGLGGGLARSELAAAVSEAGGLGTIGFLPPPVLAAELAAARRLTGRPVAVNLILPLTRRQHWAVVATADAVVTFWGRPKRRSPKVWLHQCGSVAEARAAHAAGADGVIVQGAEAGGHVRGTGPAHELLERARAELPAGYPVWLAGGIADRTDVRDALAAGADAAVLGTRFLLSDESRAHAEYKTRATEATQTILTELFGAGWPAAHRVIPNRATDRWLRNDPRGPRALRTLNRLTQPLAARAPAALASRAPFSPQPPTDHHPAGLVDDGPLYAGETVARITDIRPAAALVRDLTP